MKLLMRSLIGLAVVAAAACVTINIYFPAEEVRGAADKIVDEVWGDRAAPAKPDEQQPAVPPAGDAKPGSSMHWILSPNTAYAAQDINVSTPEIRAIRDSMKDRSDQLFPFLDSGNVGIALDGLLAIRTTDGLSLKDRAAVQRLIEAENRDRKRLYQEIARANGFPEKVDEVQAIFADTWRDKAGKGWYLEQGKGNWTRK